MSDDYYKGLCDVLNQTLERATAEIRELRAEKKQLLSDLNSVPVEMWELQERVTCLELQVRSLGAHPVTAFDGDGKETK